MTQAIENSPVWKTDYNLWSLLDKKQLSPVDWKYLYEVIALERDCERRSINLAKQWNLFDVEEYAQNANLYLFYYQYVFLKQKWIDSTSIYHPMIVEIMPKKLLPTSSFNTIKMPIMELFDQCLDKKGCYYIKGFT